MNASRGDVTRLGFNFFAPCRLGVCQGQTREPVDVSHQEGHRQSRLLPLLLSMVDSGHLQSHFPLTAGSLSAAR